MSASIFRHAAQGTGPLAVTFVVPVGSAYRLVSVSVHLNAAATTSEDLTITQDIVDSALCDTVIYSLDLSAGSTVDLLWQPDAELYLQGGDELDVAWLNTDGRTWGVTITAEAL